MCKKPFQRNFLQCRIQIIFFLFFGTVNSGEFLTTVKTHNFAQVSQTPAEHCFLCKHLIRDTFLAASARDLNPPYLRFSKVLKPPFCVHKHPKRASAFVNN
jgi:hypothetical protein